MTIVIAVGIIIACNGKEERKNNENKRRKRASRIAVYKSVYLFRLLCFIQ